MSKQEKIRKGLFLWMGAYGIKEDDMVKAGIELFRFLHAQGVVIKVERELPSINYTVPAQEKEIEDAYNKAYAGYAPFEPLIKEGDGIEVMFES